MSREKAIREKRQKNQCARVSLAQRKGTFEDLHLDPHGGPRKSGLGAEVTLNNR